MRIASELLPSVSVDAPLMEAGLDSLGAVELRSRLAARLDDAELPETLVVDFPTLRQLEAHVTTLVAPAPVPPLPAPCVALRAVAAYPAMLRYINKPLPRLQPGSNVPKLT